jgi:hypothetical protein
MGTTRENLLDIALILGDAGDIPPSRALVLVYTSAEVSQGCRLEDGAKPVIVAGSPPGTPGQTNALRVHRIGDAIAAATT